MKYVSTASILMKVKHDQQHFLRDLCTKYDEKLRNNLVADAGSWKNCVNMVFT
jgi:hypothetical protein